MSTVTRSPVKTSGGAIARVLRGLGLSNASGGRGEFSVRGLERNGERYATIAIVFDRAAQNLVRENRERIERETAELGFPFRVRDVLDGRDIEIKN